MFYFALRSFIRSSGRVLYVSQALICAALLLGSSQHLLAQAGTATLSGTITDQSGAVLPRTKVTITNDETGTSSVMSTNGSGIYNAPGLAPGQYHVNVVKEGFAQVLLRNVTLNVQDIVNRNFVLRAGGISETIQVNGDELHINDSDGSVGTVIDGNFVEKIPLNGRSFQPLIMLSPGVLTTSPQTSVGQGEFSVNGQRGNDNNFIVDGASASNSGGINAMSTYSGAGTAGLQASETTLGTTQGMAAVDALKEFRITTSTYTAEYGRSPGAQIVFQTKSGTNDYHGSLSEYLRNSAFDANNWFNDHNTPILPKAAERQNDFGGVFGGPISIPRLYSGKNRAFFFLSYEGLRLTVPTPASIYYVPSNGTYNTASNYANPLWKDLRDNTTDPVLRTVLNSFPLPNCTLQENPGCVDNGDGLSPYLQAPVPGTGTINAIGGRFDFQAAPGHLVFFRYSDTTSRSVTQSTSYAYQLVGHLRNQVYLLGSDDLIFEKYSNQLRVQFSPSYNDVTTIPDAIGGSQPASLWAIQGIPEQGESIVGLTFPADSARLYDQAYGSRMRQPNITESLSWTHGSHLFKAGLDYRQTTAYLADGETSRSPTVAYYYDSGDSVLSNTVDSGTAQHYMRQDLTNKNLGVFFQDEWRILSRLSLSLGVRWDLSPPPSVKGAQQYKYVGDLNNPASVTLSSLGAPAYPTTYTDFAPRFGTAFKIRTTPGWEMVLRGGVGLYYATGQELTSVWGAGQGLGSTANSRETAQPNGFPFPTSTILAPVTGTSGTPPYALGYVVSPNYAPPKTIQWNVTIEQSIGGHQSITAGYVGSNGRDLPVTKEYNITASNSLFSPFYQIENGPGSSYNSLQVQYKRFATRNLQVIGSYTWSHALDYRSTPTTLTPYGFLQRGNSDNDVRHNFSGAISYQSPNSYQSRLEKAVLADWGLHLIGMVHTGFPVTLVGANVFDPVSYTYYASTVNWNGQNPYVYKSGIPGGRQFNPAVFSIPASTDGPFGNSPRNFLRGFGSFEINPAIERNFPIYEQFRLLFRAEAFNVTNHPNFGVLNLTCGTNTAGATCTNVLLGQATATLNNSLQGRNALYQQGGPRSLQLALKLQF